MLEFHSFTCKKFHVEIIRGSKFLIEKCIKFKQNRAMFIPLCRKKYPESVGMREGNMIQRGTSEK